MHVSVESTSTLGRKMKVEVPAERVEEEIAKRLQSMTRTVRVHGFRPGKVPLKVVRQRFGEQVKRDVMGELLQKTFLEALDRERLRPAGTPKIEAGDLAAQPSLEYTATFEVYPEVAVRGVDALEIRRPVVKIGAEGIDTVIDRLREQRRRWEPVSRPAQEGDQLTVDFTGTIEGEAFPGGEAEDFSIELGSGRMIPGFEEQLIGAQAGEERTVEILFPDDYRDATLAGKKARFQVKVKEVAEPVLPAVDEAFAEGFGVKEGGVEAFRSEVRSNMERELRDKIKSKLKEQVMDGLLEHNPIEVPTPLVKEEIARMRRGAMEMVGSSDEDAFPDEQFEAAARKRVALGLLINEIVRHEGLKPEDEKIQSVLEGIASGYEDPQQVINYYRANREAMADVGALVLEEQVVDWVLGRAKVEDEPTTFQALVGTGDSEAED